MMQLQESLLVEAINQGPHAVQLFLNEAGVKKEDVVVFCLKRNDIQSALMIIKHKNQEADTPVMLDREILKAWLRNFKLDEQNKNDFLEILNYFKEKKTGNRSESDVMFVMALQAIEESKPEILSLLFE